MKKLFRFEFIIALLILSSHVIAAVSPHNGLMNWFRTDDAFYYFQTARNISQGSGITFDGINLTNGFHPLWMLICIPVFSLARWDLYLPFRILVIILGIFNAASAILIFRWLKRIFSSTIGMIAAIFWAFSPTIHALTSEGGLETGLSTFLIILLLSRISLIDEKERNIRNLIPLGIIASLVFLARLDNIYLLLFLGTWVVISDKKLRNLLVIDTFILFFSAYLSLMLRIGAVFDLPVYELGIYTFIFLSILSKIPMIYFFGLYQSNRSESSKNLFLKVVGSILSAQLIIGIPMIILSRAANWFNFPRSVLIIDILVSVPLLALPRLVGFYLFPAGEKDEISPRKYLVDSWRRWLNSFISYYGILFTTITGYMLINLAIFHTLTPVSGQIKQWWGRISTIYGKNVDSIMDALGSSSRFWKLINNFFIQTKPLISSQIFSLLVIVIMFIVIVLIIKDIRRILRQFDDMLLFPLLAGSLWQIWTYNIRSYVGFRDWYWIAQNLLVILGIMVIIYQFFNIFSEPAVKKIVMYGTLILISSWIGISYISHEKNLISVSQEEEGEYLFGVSFLEQQTQPGSIIGMTGGGTTAYFIEDRTIVNMDGLINSYEYFQSLKLYEASNYLDSMGLQYVFAKPYIVNESSPYKKEFSVNLKWLENYQDYSLFSFGNH
ncbi:MAG: glycosyltransferase family 39 protein [Anaerolineales bacterium]